MTYNQNKGEIMKAVFKGITQRGFEWIVTVNGHNFDYFTGFGHISTNKSKYKFEPVDDMEINAQVLNVMTRQRYLEVGKQAFNRIAPSKPYYINEPEEMDVLYCLYSDAQMGNETFEDFCGNCGYDTDSRQALETYLACQSTGHKLRGFEFPQVILDGEY
jgi:hypothetical protein